MTFFSAAEAIAGQAAKLIEKHIVKNIVKSFMVIPHPSNENFLSMGLQEVVWVIFCDFKAAEACK